MTYPAGGAWACGANAASRPADHPEEVCTGQHLAGLDFFSQVYPPAFRVRVSAGNIKRDTLDNEPRLSRL